MCTKNTAVFVLNSAVWLITSLITRKKNQFDNKKKNKFDNKENVHKKKVLFVLNSAVWLITTFIHDFTSNHMVL